MTTSSTQPDLGLPWERRGAAEEERESLHLAVAWSLEEPERAGEVFSVRGACVLGRGAELPDDPAPRVRFHRQRPDADTPTRPLEGPRISRLQLQIRPIDDASMEVTSVGRCQLLVNGAQTTRAVVRIGDTVTLRNALVLLVVRRRPLRSILCPPDAMAFPFGGADVHGIVGESPAIWRLRDALGAAAASGHHILLTGESGAGKELAARALHALSSRHARPLVARNAATFPEGLVDAELFGTTKNYPNVGSPERVGLIGEADGSTLFLDEIGELPVAMQAHLLRVLDLGGEYQRLGESRRRSSDLRVVAATNRAASELKHDFAARFAARIALPGLGHRREDIPLLVRHLLARAAVLTPTFAACFFERRHGTLAEARIEPELLELLVRHRYTHHLRELERLLWTALSTSKETFIAATPEVKALLEGGDDERPAAPPDRADVLAALASAGGNVTRAARNLGLKNRFVLYRLMKRLDLAVPEEGDA